MAACVLREHPSATIETDSEARSGIFSSATSIVARHMLTRVFLGLQGENENDTEVVSSPITFLRRRRARRRRRPQGDDQDTHVEAADPNDDEEEEEDTGDEAEDDDEDDSEGVGTVVHLPCT